MFHQMILFAQAPVEAVPVEQLQVALQDQEMAAAAVGVFLLFILFWVFLCLVMTVVLTVIPLWIICKKAGILPYISLLILVPGVNIAFHWILALIQWPNLKTENPNRSAPPANPGELSHFQKERYDRDSHFPST